MTYRELMDKKELLDFSQNFSVTRTYMGSSLFPDRKAQYIQAEYFRFVKNGTLPQSAMVHSFDTEAHIASRIPLERMNIEQLLIKEKINQTEEIRKITNGMQVDNVRQYVFDDIARMAEMIVTRVERAKMEVVATGKMTIKENSLDMVIDYGVPDTNRVKGDWNSTNADIIGDLDEWRALARANGVNPNRIITTEAVVSKIKRNATIQKAISGVSGAGILPTLEKINALLQEHVGMTIMTNDGYYGVPVANGEGKIIIGQKRYFPENTIVMVAIGSNGSLGTGLWGVTPEEESVGGTFNSLRQQQFVTVTQWSDQDPVGVWTKASGVFVPVMPNIYGHVIADLTGTGAEG